jgi:hypothetical protein
MKILNVLKTIRIIVLSRLKKPKEELWIKARRKVCSSCEFNSINVEKIPLDKKILIKLSNFYSCITFKSKIDNLGNCTACQSCSIYYATAEKLEKCKKNKWK